MTPRKKRCVDGQTVGGGKNNSRRVVKSGGSLKIRNRPNHNDFGGSGKTKREGSEVEDSDTGSLSDRSVGASSKVKYDTKRAHSRETLHNKSLNGQKKYHPTRKSRNVKTSVSSESSNDKHDDTRFDGDVMDAPVRRSNTAKEQHSKGHRKHSLSEISDRSGSVDERHGTNPKRKHKECASSSGRGSKMSKGLVEIEHSSRRVAKRGMSEGEERSGRDSSKGASQMSRVRHATQPPRPHLGSGTEKRSLSPRNLPPPKKLKREYSGDGRTSGPAASSGASRNKAGASGGRTSGTGSKRLKDEEENRNRTNVEVSEEERSSEIDTPKKSVSARNYHKTSPKRRKLVGVVKPWKPNLADLVWAQPTGGSFSVGICISPPKRGKKYYVVAFIAHDTHCYVPLGRLKEFDPDTAQYDPCMRHGRLNKPRRRISSPKADETRKQKREAITDALTYLKGKHKFEKSHNFALCNFCNNEASGDFWAKMGVAKAPKHTRDAIARMRASGRTRGSGDSGDAVSSEMEEDSVEDNAVDRKSRRNATESSRGVGQESSENQAEEKDRHMVNNGRSAKTAVGGDKPSGKFDRIKTEVNDDDADESSKNLEFERNDGEESSTLSDDETRDHMLLKRPTRAMLKQGSSARDKRRRSDGKASGTGAGGRKVANAREGNGSLQTNESKDKYLASEERHEQESGYSSSSEGQSEYESAVKAVTSLSGEEERRLDPPSPVHIEECKGAGEGCVAGEAANCSAEEEEELSDDQEVEVRTLSRSGAGSGDESLPRMPSIPGDTFVSGGDCKTDDGGTKEEGVSAGEPPMCESRMVGSKDRGGDDYAGDCSESDDSSSRSYIEEPVDDEEDEEGIRNTDSQTIRTGGIEDCPTSNGSVPAVTQPSEETNGEAMGELDNDICGNTVASRCVPVVDNNIENVAASTNDTAGSQSDGASFRSVAVPTDAAVLVPEEGVMCGATTCDRSASNQCEPPNEGRCRREEGASNVDNSSRRNDVTSGVVDECFRPESAMRV